MEPTKITRPKFPKGYVDKPVSYLTWDWVATRLTESKHYWICSVRPDGRPHVVPRWCVFVDGKIYYDGSPETRHAINIGSNPNVTVHLENGQEAVILEGTSNPAGRPSRELGKELAQAYKKYKEYAIDCTCSYCNERRKCAGLSSSFGELVPHQMHQVASVQTNYNGERRLLRGSQKAMDKICNLIPIKALRAGSRVSNSLIQIPDLTFHPLSLPTFKFF